MVIKSFDSSGCVYFDGLVKKIADMKIIFDTKKIGKLWYAYATVNGYDYSFCSDSEFHACILAKAVMQKNGYLDLVDFPVNI